jgi:excisionase family DNA binding protein
MSEQSEQPKRKKHHRPAGTYLAYNPGEAAQQIGCSRRKIFEMIADGRLASTKLGRQRLITHSTLMRLIEPVEEPST